LIESGCKLYGLKSNGIHSNGFSLVNKLLKYYEYDIDTLLKPTKIYMECFNIIEKYKDILLGMAHITGGGLIDNIKRIIPKKLNIKLDIKIENEFKWIMEKSKINENDMMNTFNCGYGMVLIFKKDFINKEFEEIGYLD
jgi:Phosphoribosylaminoimidazole (AIR) synthetase